MLFKRIICIAAALCLLCAAALADAGGPGGSGGSVGPGGNGGSIGPGGSGGSVAPSVPAGASAPGAAAGSSSIYYGPTIDIRSKGVYPTSWETQDDTGAELRMMPYLLDGDRLTGFEHVCWNAKALDEIPELTFYFPGISLRELWVRNGWETDRYPYTYFARILRMDVTVWCGDTMYGPYKFTLEDTNDDSILTPQMIDGYQRLSLPVKLENVTSVELWIKGWYKGDEKPYIAYLSDLAFYTDTVESFYGNYIYDYTYTYPAYMPTTAPTAVPTAVPVPAVTPRPAATEAPKGVDVLTKQSLVTLSGPGTGFTDSGTYLDGNAWVKALSAAYDPSAETWWIQVELTYNNEKRRVYTGVKQLNMAADQVSEEEVQYSAVLLRSVYAYWGPGYGYTMYSDPVVAGTSGTVWQTEGSYAQFEFFDEGEQMMRRVWVPVSALEQGAVG